METLGADMRKLGDRKDRSRRWLLALAATLMTLHVSSAVAQDGQDGIGAAPNGKAPASSVVAQAERTHNFNIPSKPLPRALTDFSAVTGLQVLYTERSTFNRTAPALNGTFSARDALRRLLAGSGLVGRFTASDTVTVERPGSRTADEPLQLDPITVEGKAESAYGPVEGYKASRSATATKTDTPIIDVPQSIQVVPREVIEDQKATSLADVAKNVSGVQASGTFGNRAEALRVRGFEQFAFTADGMPSSQFFVESFLDLANVERVEVVKGPASVIYGQGEPGGRVNLVTKKPLDEARYAADVTAGGFGFVRPTIDLSAPITDDKSVKVRLNAAYQREGSFRDFFVDSERKFFAPVGTWEISPKTRLTVSGQYAEQRNQFDRGVVALGNGVADVPNSRYLGEKFSTFEANQTRLRYLLEHNFNDAWSVRNSTRFLVGNSIRFSADPRGLLADNRTLRRRTAFQESDNREIRFQNDIVGKLGGDLVRHDVLFGFEAARAERKVRSAAGALAPIDIFNPVYGAGPGPLGAFVTTDNSINLIGVYLQDQVSIGRRWRFLVGGRFDRAALRNEFNSAATEKTEGKFSPRGGVVFKPADAVSVYASYSQSFNPKVGTTFDGTPYRPETGEQFELGVKTEFFNRRLSIAAAAFQLTRENVLTSDPNNPGFSLQTGEQRSRGLELDIAGEIAPGWKVIASGALIEAEITEDNTFEPGNRIGNVPEVSGSLWTTYEFQRDGLKGLGFGAGFFAVGERKGDLANTFEANGYIRTDATVFYNYRDKVKAQLNVENLFDIDYVEAPRSRNEVYPGAPLTVLGALTIRL